MVSVKAGEVHCGRGPSLEGPLSPTIVPVERGRDLGVGHSGASRKSGKGRRGPTGRQGTAADVRLRGPGSREDHNAVAVSPPGVGVVRRYDQAMTRTEDIIASIYERLRRLNEEIGTLTAARVALDDRGAPETRRRQRDPTRQVTHEHDTIAAPATPEPMRDGIREASREMSAPAPERTRARAKPARRRKRGSVEVVAAGQLEALLSENGGMTTSVLAERVNGTREQILTALRELETAGRVRRSGQRRSTRWHAITDEERIEKRAAELAARSKESG